MSITAVNWAFNQDLKPTHKFILVALADCADDYGVCFPSHRHIEKKTGYSKRAIRAAISELDANGLLERVTRFRSNMSNTSNAYRLPIVKEISDHPLSPLFKDGGGQEMPPWGQEMPEGGQEMPQGGAGDAPLEPSLKSSLNLKEKKALSRDVFLLEINRRLKDGFFDGIIDRDLEAYVNTVGNQAYDHWEGYGFPPRDIYSAFKGYLRIARADDKLTRKITEKNNKDNGESPELSQWRARVNGFQNGLAWMSSWGAEPDQPDTKVPTEILKDFEFNKEKENEVSH